MYSKFAESLEEHTMASLKLSLPVALLLCGFMVMGNIQSTEAAQGKICAMYCLDAKYMTCPSTGREHRTPACNCCLADNKEKGCTVYLSNGGTVKCT